MSADAATAQVDSLCGEASGHDSMVTEHPGAATKDEIMQPGPETAARPHSPAADMSGPQRGLLLQPQRTTASDAASAVPMSQQPGDGLRSSDASSELTHGSNMVPSSLGGAQLHTGAAEAVAPSQQVQPANHAANGRAGVQESAADAAHTEQPLVAQTSVQRHQPVAQDGAGGETDITADAMTDDRVPRQGVAVGASHEGSLSSAVTEDSDPSPVAAFAGSGPEAAAYDARIDDARSMPAAAVVSCSPEPRGGTPRDAVAAETAPPSADVVGEPLPRPTNGRQPVRRLGGSDTVQPEHDSGRNAGTAARNEVQEPMPQPAAGLVQSTEGDGSDGSPAAVGILDKPGSPPVADALLSPTAASGGVTPSVALLETDSQPDHGLRQTTAVARGSDAVTVTPLQDVSTGAVLAALALADDDEIDAWEPSLWMALYDAPALRGSSDEA